MRAFSTKENIKLISQFLTRYPSVRRFNDQSEDAISAYQWKKIKELIDVAYFHTPFYRRRYGEAGIHPRDVKTWDDFYNLPMVTKDELIEFNSEFVDERLDPENLFLSRSSGSSGKFVNLYLDADHFITQQLQVVRMLSEFYPGYRPRDRELLIYTSEYPFHSIGGFYTVDYVNNLESIETIFTELQRVKPVMIAIYPSILRELLWHYPNEIRAMHLKAVITNSEQSSEGERQAFENVLGCPVFDEFSSEEVSGIAYQCSEKRYHLVPDAAYIEIVDMKTGMPMPEGKLGEIIGTNILNYAMPLIRYRQGDLASLKPTSCSCGKKVAELERLSGRINSSFRCCDGVMIPSGRVLDWTYSLVLEHALDIREFQVIQHRENSVEVKIVPGKRFQVEHDTPVIIESFNESLHSGFEVQVTAVEKIDRTASGKFIPIQSYV